MNNQTIEFEASTVKYKIIMDLTDIEFYSIQDDLETIKEYALNNGGVYKICQEIYIKGKNRIEISISNLPKKQNHDIALSSKIIDFKDFLDRIGILNVKVYKTDN